MKRMTLTLAATALIGAGIGNTAAQADGWDFPAFNKPGYTAEPTLSLMVGRMSPGDEFRSAAFGGIELSVNCPTLQPPTNRIRQQFSFTRYDKNDVEINSLEINPHYVVEIAPGLEVGGGPGLGFLMVDTPVGDGNVFGLQLGASAHYFAMDPLFFGAEARYQFTTEDNFGPGPKTDVNNFRFAVKVGYSF